MIEAAAECADGGDHEGFLIYGHAPLSPPEDEWWAWVADENDFPPDYERLYGPTPYVAEEVHRAV
jgi:hypothetical protein